MKPMLLLDWNEATAPKSPKLSPAQHSVRLTLGILRQGFQPKSL
jgi:hypothetical protein